MTKAKVKLPDIEDWDNKDFVTDAVSYLEKAVWVSDHLPAINKLVKENSSWVVSTAEKCYIDTFCKDGHRCAFFTALFPRIWQAFMRYCEKYDQLGKIEQVARIAKQKYPDEKIVDIICKSILTFVADDTLATYRSEESGQKVKQRMWAKIRNWIF